MRRHLHRSQLVAAALGSVVLGASIWLALPSSTGAQSCTAYCKGIDAEAYVMDKIGKVVGEPAAGLLVDLDAKHAVSLARRVVKHPHRHPKIVRRTRHAKERGARILRKVGGDARKIGRWFGRHFSRRHLRRRMNRMARNCAILGSVAFGFAEYRRRHDHHRHHGGVLLPTIEACAGAAALSALGG
jgi:hypothetical protein